MSSTQLNHTPRLLLFPQVGRPEGKDGRPTVRRYSLTLLTGAAPRAERGVPRAKPTRG